MPEKTGTTRRTGHMGKAQNHGLGFGNGSIIDHGDGVIEYRQTGKLLPAFKINIGDVTGVSVRRATRQDKKSLGASGMQQVLTIQGGGTDLAACAVNFGTAEKIEAWLRAHPAFGGRQLQSQLPDHAASSSATASLGDELAKLAQLRDSGVLTTAEFEQAKSKLLS
jgi:hypothetical protein